MPLLSPTVTDDRARYVSQLVHETEKNMASMKKALSGYIGNQEKLRNRSLKLAVALKSYANGETPCIKEALNGMAEHLQELQKHRKYMQDRLEIRAREPLGVYKNMSKAVRMELKMRDSALKREQQKKVQLDSIAIRDAGNRSKITQHQLELTGAATEVTHSNMSLLDTVQKFELQKIDDLKIFLNEFIYSEMQYHCRALEVLSAAKDHLDSVDMTEDLQFIRDHLRLHPIT